MRLYLVFIVLFSCIIISIGLVLLINKFKNKKLKRSLKIIYTISISFILLLFSSLFYLISYTKADDKANDYLISNSNVEVITAKDYYFFNSSNEDTAIIFYPGAKIETKAYAPLLNKLASNNIDAFIVDFPFHMAFFDINAADKIINNYNYKNIYIMGHSLGGSMAANYLINHLDRLKGIILLASYTTYKIPDYHKLLSIYGTNDGCLNMKNYQKYHDNFPSNFQELIIEGGNHTNFGLYDMQSGDNPSTISLDTQQELTIEAIKNFI